MDDRPFRPSRRHAMTTDSSEQRRKRTSAKRWILLVGLSVNFRFLIPQLRWTLKIFQHAQTLSLEQKRLILFPTMYPDILRIRRIVPENATLWVVSPFMPSHINYLLYPRTLCIGSKSMGDLNKIRSLHPKDWVLTHFAYDPQKDRIEIFPPIHPAS